METEIKIIDGEQKKNKILIKTQEGYSFCVEVFGDSIYVSTETKNPLSVTTTEKINTIKVKIDLD
jgi:hypothetical protein